MVRHEADGVEQHAGVLSSQRQAVADQMIRQARRPEQELALRSGA
jgi:hypothetical protein